MFAVAGTTEAQGWTTSRSNTTDQMFSMFGIQGDRSGNAQIPIDGASSTALDWGGLMVQLIARIAAAGQREKADKENAEFVRLDAISASEKARRPRNRIT